MRNYLVLTEVHCKFAHLCSFEELPSNLNPHIRTFMKKLIIWSIILLSSWQAYGQRTLSIDSCRSLALSGNRELAIRGEQRIAAHNQRKAAFTSYLPSLSASGSYIRNQKETQLLSDEAKLRLQNIGTGTMQGLAPNMAQLAQTLQAMAMARPDLAPLLKQMGQMSQQFGLSLASQLNASGASLVEAMRTDTRNIFLGALTITQPIYMGGKIRAYNQITRHAEQIALEQERAGKQEVVMQVDQAYWQVVSLANKKRLAESYLQLLRKLESDVQHLIASGIATKADELTIRVKLNEAEVSMLKVADGLILSRMLLCQLCGLQLDEPIRLVDEDLNQLPRPEYHLSNGGLDEAYRDRPELRSLELLHKLQREKVDLARAEYLPSLALVGNYVVSNPSLYNGFENKFGGMWNVGVTLRVPLWHWGEGLYKVRAARAEARAAGLRLDEARSKVALQLDQAKLKLSEASKLVQLSESNMDKAEENLRHANLAFSEGMIPMTSVLEAQTAWLSAKSSKIDAIIDYRLASIYLSKALGRLAE